MPQRGGHDADRIWAEIFGWGRTAISVKFSLAVLVLHVVSGSAAAAAAVALGGLASAILDGGQR